MCPYRNHWDGPLMSVGLGCHTWCPLPFGLFDITTRIGFSGCCWVWVFFLFFKKKVAAAQNVTTCPFYWQLMLNWSLDILASTTQVANTLPPPLLFQCWCFNLKPLFFEWMQAVLPNNSIRVTMATAFHCWGWECEKEKLVPISLLNVINENRQMDI